ncbi:response regulator [Paenibacillus hemerocallicola]|uniref:Oxygen sensor histidine kinase NreB n=1 Tax=Paenibacillus hemerocallicola TaxID=1172614 RepID=A0A5C4SZ74_9BACL|nr:ATP-binding protein [Paenibacillus hemerocallicola]TNJ61585.1 response regulator [Paenibacillus hemerocallicola]
MLPKAVVRKAVSRVKNVVVPLLLLLAAFVFVLAGIPGIDDRDENSPFIPDQDWKMNTLAIGWEQFRGDRPSDTDRWEPLDNKAFASLPEYEGTLWLRKTMPDSIPWRDPYLFVWGVKGMELFLDGKSVYAFNVDGLERYINQAIPFNPVRLQEQDAGKQLMLRLPWEHSSLPRTWNLIGERSVMLASQMQSDALLLLCSVPLLLAAAIACLLIVRRPKERLYIWFALFASSSGLGLYWLRSTPMWFESLHGVYYWRDMAIPLGILGFAGFYAEALGSMHSRLQKAVIGFWSAYSLATAAAAAADAGLYRKLLVDYLPYCIVPVFLVVTINLIRQCRSNRSPSVKWLLLGYGVLVLSFLNHIVLIAYPMMSETIARLYPSLYVKLTKSLPFGLLLFMGCLAMVLVQRFLDVYRQSQKYAGELAAQHETLVRMDRLKDDFLRTTSHELRTPLHGIAGLTGSMLEGAAGPVDERMRDNLQLVLSSSNRLLRLVNDILDLYRLKHFDVRLQPEAVDVRRIAGVVLAVLSPAADRKGLRMSLRIPDECASVWADSGRFEQILYNLIGNAVKYTESGSVLVRATRDRSFVRIAVEDTGNGMARDKLDSIYEPFAASDGAEGGTGLGLSITKRLVELQGGTIEASSEVGRGTVISVLLPHTEEQPSNSPDARYAEIAKFVTEDSLDERDGIAPEELDFLVGKTGEAAGGDIPLLLIVDDEPVNIRVLLNYLQNASCRLLQAKDGFEALALLESGIRPDLVLLDVMMPKMTGYEVCRRIRGKWNGNELPVILMSARNRVADLEEGFDAGANDYLPKPFAQRELFARVAIQLRLLQFHRSLEQLVEKRTKELEDTNRLLAGSVRETAAALAELSVMEERNRIAHEIHDVVGHTMTAAIVQLEAAYKLAERDIARSKEKLENAQQLVRKGLNDIRVSVRLLKDEGAAFELVPAMKELIRETEDSTGVSVDTTIGNLPDMNGLTRRVLYHALQEGLTNGIRHGRCQKFRFGLTATDAEIRLMLVNDGIPFADAKPGFGLTAMMERVHLLGGTVEIRPDSPASGCKLSVTLPVPEYAGNFQG